MNKHDTLLLSCGSVNNRKILRSILEEKFNLLESTNLSQTVKLLEQNINCIAAVLLDITDVDTINKDDEKKSLIDALHNNAPLILICENDFPKIIDNIIYGRGIGKSKKEAEQKAALDAYNKQAKV